MYFLSAIIFFFISLTYLIICLFLVKNTLIILIAYAFIAFKIYKYYSKEASRLGKNLSLITSNIGNLPPQFLITLNNKIKWEGKYCNR